ncbi:MAG: PEP/pyruvate-binding domain-containing protein [Caldilineaceae bacterium]
MHNTFFRLGTELPNAYTQIGVKAATLNQLILAGFPVPPGLCVPVAMFKQAIAPFTAQIDALCVRADLRDSGVAQSTAQAIVTLLEDLHLPFELQQALTDALPSLGDAPLAVRSSATLEDLADASFAGQYQSVIGVQGADELAEAILTCWRSFYSANALAARAAYALTHQPAQPDDHGMAVLIQPLLNADCAGVCFSIDPVRQQADWLLVTAGWGLGVGVVEGSVPVDTFRVRRADCTVAESVIADKESCIRYAPTQPDPGMSLQPVAVAADRRGVACLPRKWLQRVAQFALAAEQTLGQPQDMEWAITGQNFWLLQSRPITTLPTTVRQQTHFPITWANAAERQRLWWLERQTERPSATLLPAEIEFIQTCSTRGGQAAVELSGGAKTRWRKVVNGRIYMAVADSPLQPGDRRIRRAARDDLFARLAEEQVTLWEHWGPEIIRATERLDAFDGSAADDNALADHLEDALAAAHRHWMIHTMMPRDNGCGPLLASYQQLSGKNAAAARADLPYLLQGVDTVQTRLIELLYDLACLALVYDPVVAELQNHTPGGYVRLCNLPEAAPFVEQFRHVLAIYGGRVGLFTQGVDGESTIALPLPWRAAPDQLLAMVGHYLPLAQGHQSGDQANAPRIARQQAQAEQQASVDALCAAAGDPTLVAQFRRHLAFARRSAAFLDDHNHYIDQLSAGQTMQALLYGGRWLTDRGDLPHPYEVFWLYPTEVLATLRAEDKGNYSELIAQRKADFSRWETLQTPPYIGLPDPQLPTADQPERRSDANGSDAQSNTVNRLIGRAVSAGRRLGRARVIHDAADLPTVAAGDVLVAAQANPLWTSLFPALAAIVLDMGGPGDHAAITAREFGIPAIFGTGQATDRIPEGAWVTVDSDSGSVTWA